MKKSKTLLRIGIQIGEGSGPLFALEINMPRRRPRELQGPWHLDNRRRPPTPYPFTDSNRERTLKSPKKSICVVYRYVAASDKPRAPSGPYGSASKEAAIDAQNKDIALRPVVPEFPPKKRVRFQLPEASSPSARAFERLSHGDRDRQRRCASCGQLLN